MVKGLIELIKRIGILLLIVICIRVCLFFLMYLWTLDNAEILIVLCILTLVTIFVSLCYRIRRENKKNLELQELEQEKLREAIKNVSKYCNYCGLLVYDKEGTKKYCAACGRNLRDVSEDEYGLMDTEPDNWDRTSTLLYSNMKPLYSQGRFDEIISHVKEEDENNNAIAQYFIAICHKNTDAKIYMDKLMQSVEQGYSMALYELGLNYYHGEFVEKNNILSQKYLEQAARSNGGGRGGLGVAFRVITALCERSEFRWSDTVHFAAEGYAKAAIRADIYSLQKMYSGNYNLEKLYLERGIITCAPSENLCRLWWAIKAAELGDLNAVEVIFECIYTEMNKLVELRHYPEANKLYLEYEELYKYWTEKEVHMRYPDPDCYEAHLAEENNEFEKALDLYRCAAERNNQQAIEAVRRLTGNKNYKLRTGRLQPEDYLSIYNKAQSLLQNGEYDLCLIQARKALEIYVHNLFFEKKVDMPENDDLNNLIKELYEMRLVDEKTYKAMDYVRRKGNSAVHGTEKMDAETARHVVDALTQIITNKQ